MSSYDDRVADLYEQIDSLEVTNADLLAALKTIVAARDNYHGGDLVRAVDAALPAIAKAEEGQA